MHCDDAPREAFDEIWTPKRIASPVRIAGLVALEDTVTYDYPRRRRTLRMGTLMELAVRMIARGAWSAGRAATRVGVAPATWR